MKVIFLCTQFAPTSPTECYHFIMVPQNKHNIKVLIKVSSKQEETPWTCYIMHAYALHDIVVDG